MQTTLENKTTVHFVEVSPAQPTPQLQPGSIPALLPALTITHPANWLIDNAITNDGATYELWSDDPISTGTIEIMPIDAIRWTIRVDIDHNLDGSNWRSVRGEDIQLSDTGLITSRQMLARLIPADVLQDAIELWLEDRFFDTLPENLMTVGPACGEPDDCPVCNGWGAMEHIIDPELMDCPACKGSGRQPGTPGDSAYWQQVTKQRNAAAQMVIPF